jgi:uncharacterized protein (TIGR00730 family)
MGSIEKALEKKKNIAVFCSAQDLDEKYVVPARELARLIAENGYGLVWGGSNTGLMREIAAGVHAGGGKLYGVSMELLKHLVREDAEEMVIAKNLSERKAKLLEKCDAVVVLVGGIGTLDEFSDVLALKKHELHHKPIVILNTDNFYAGLQEQLQKMKDEGFITKVSLEDLLHFSQTPDEVIDYIDNKLS